MMKVYGAPENHYTIHVELEEIEQKLRAEQGQGSVLSEWSVPQLLSGHFLLTEDRYRMMFAPKMGYRVLLGMVLQMFQQRMWLHNLELKVADSLG